VIDYEGVDAKLDRAVEHLDVFEHELGVWMQGDPPVMTIKPHPGDAQSEDLYFEIKVPAPTVLNMSLGDSVHNFRSTLDHLAMTLALDNGADPYDRSIGFPICGTFRAYHGHEQHEPVIPPPRWSGAYKVRALRPAAQTFIEGLQPYRQNDLAWTLSELQQLDNRDKHRSLIEINPEAIATFHPAPGTTVTWVDPLRLENGARFATVTFDANYSGVKVYPPVPVGVGVEHSNRIGWLPLPGYLRTQLLVQVRRIVSDAERLFP